MKRAMRALFLVLSALALASTSAAQRAVERSELELQHVARTRVRYGHAAWPSGAPRAGLANALALSGFTAGPLASAEGLVTRELFHAGSLADAPASAVLETRVADTVADARELLIEWLAGLQSATPAPPASEVGLAIGDVAYVGRAGAGPNALAWIAFVRGNVAVRVSACDPVREPALDLGALATEVDQAIGRAPALETGRLPARPLIATLAASPTSVVAGTAVILEVSVADPAGGAPHLQWVVGGPGQGYVELGRDGVLRLHTTGSGAIALALEVTGSTGTWTRREIALDVLDD